MIEEHLKNRVEQYSHSRSFNINPGAMLSFGVNQAVGSGMMAAPVDRKVSSSSAREDYSCRSPGAGGAFARQAFASQSGIHIKENHVVIGEKIEIKPELENHEYLKVRDTAPISSIGNISAGIQEIKENLEAIHKPHHHDIIIDAEPVENDVITEARKEEKKPVIADVEPKIPEKQEDFSIRQDELHEIIDEIYYEDIAPYHEFEDMQRPGSPDRVETELTKAVGDVIDHAKELEKHVNCYTKAVFQVVGYVSEAFSAPLKPVNEYVISPALDALDTQVRRTLRDDCRFSQGFAQDAGDMSSFVAGLLIPCRIAKIPGKITKLKVPDRVAQRKVGNVGKFSELTKDAPKGGFQDGKQAHHLPSQRYLEHYGLGTKEGLAIMMTKPQHAKTRTYGRKGANLSLDNSYRSELARDLKDVKKILKQDGSWNSEVRQSILSGLDNFKKEYPQLFEKVKK